MSFKEDLEKIGVVYLDFAMEHSQLNFVTFYFCCWTFSLKSSCVHLKSLKTLEKKHPFSQNVTVIFSSHWFFFSELKKMQYWKLLKYLLLLKSPVFFSFFCVLQRAAMAKCFCSSSERSSFKSVSSSFSPSHSPSLHPSYSFATLLFLAQMQKSISFCFMPLQGNERLWIRLSVLFVVAKFLSPLTQVMTDTLTCSYSSPLMRCRHRRRAQHGHLNVPEWMLVLSLCQKVQPDCTVLFRRWNLWGERIFGGKLNMTVITVETSAEKK